jgi:hypothetical protein
MALLVTFAALAAVPFLGSKLASISLTPTQIQTVLIVIIIVGVVLEFLGVFPQGGGRYDDEYLH